LVTDAQHALTEWEGRITATAGEDAVRQIERDAILDAIDQTWREHLYEMDYLKLGIGLRAMAQRDPVVEYQREGYDMFARMVEALKERCVEAIFRASGSSTTS
jgi:preprotein translocase subunit SecA